MFKLFSAENLQQAYLLQGLLATAGIESRIMNEYAQGALGEIPFTHTYPEIWLLEPADLARAQEILTAFERQSTRQDSVFCRHCHEANPANFETCWHCGKPL